MPPSEHQIRATGADVVSIKQWEDALYSAATAGSHCVRDTWAKVPTDIRAVLEADHRACLFIAMAADTEAMLATRH
jgi:malate/lactate dehydrogenase